MKTTGQLSFAKLPKTYDGLIRLHMPRPIRDKVGYANTVEIVDAMAGHKLNRDQADFLDLLSDLVERYEHETVAPAPSATGLEMLKFLMEQRDMSGDQLAEILGVDRSLAFKILKGTRALTAVHVKTLATHFHVSADLLLA